MCASFLTIYKVLSTLQIVLCRSDEVPESTVEPEYDEDGQIIERPAEEAVWKIVASEPQQAAEPKVAAPG